MKFKKYIVSLIVVAIIAIFTVNTASAAYVSIGSRGSDVEYLQGFLIEQGYSIPAIESGAATPGYFGEQTRNALLKYQADNNLGSTGSIDTEGLTEQKLGAFSGPFQFSPFMNNNGVISWYFNSIALAGSSTTCSVKLPSATTTLEFASFYATNLASSTMIEIGYDGTAYATTTSLVKTGTGAAPLPTGGGSLATGSSTILVGSTAAAPKYINWKLGYNGIAGATPVTSGVCKAILRQIDNKN